MRRISTLMQDSISLNACQKSQVTVAKTAGTSAMGRS